MCNTIGNYTLTCVYILVHQTTLNFRILDKNPTCCRLSQESRIFLYFSFFGRINHCLSLRNQVGFILKSRSSTTEKRTSTNTTLDETDFCLMKPRDCQGNSPSSILGARCLRGEMHSFALKRLPVNLLIDCLSVHCSVLSILRLTIVITLACKAPLHSLSQVPTWCHQMLL